MIRGYYIQPLNDKIKISIDYDAFLQHEDSERDFYNYDIYSADYITDDLFNHDIVNISDQHTISGSLS